MVNVMNGFKLFGGTHWVYILIAVVVVVGLYIALRNANEKLQKYVGVAMVSLLGLFVILDMVGRLIDGEDFFESLPLAPWQVFAYIAIFVQFTKRESWIKFGYFITIPLTIIEVFIVPNYYIGLTSFSISTIAYFLGHATLIIYSILSLIWSEEYLSKKDILNSTINYVIIIAFVHIFNVILRFSTLAVHANYFGTIGEEYDVVIKFVYGLISIPFVHVIPLIGLLVLIEFLMILPFDLMKTKKDRREQMEELVALGNLKAQQQARKNKKGGSQVLVRSENKARPDVQKSYSDYSKKDGFVSVNKTVQTHNDEHK